MFKHDCDKCTYICTTVENGEWGECYIHINHKSDQNIWSAIIRTGNDGPNYMSRQVGDLHTLNREHGSFNSWMTLRETALGIGLIQGTSLVVPNQYDDAYREEEDLYEASLRLSVELNQKKAVSD
jgi:hypothetical protein